LINAKVVATEDEVSQIFESVLTDAVRPRPLARDGKT
jgi:hypothetical protein